MSTLARKGWRDLARHRARTLLALATLGIAVASLGFLAVPGLLGAAMNRQVAESHLNDVGIFTRVLNLAPAQLRALGRLPGVAAVSPVLSYTAQARSAAGTRNVAIAGGDLASAPVNTVPLMAGRLPGRGEVLADAGNSRATGYGLPDGATIRVRAASGRLVPLKLTGTGLNLAATPGANGSGTPVFYANLATVEALRGVHGYDFLGFRLTRNTAANQAAVISEVRRYLTSLAGSDPVTALPYTRAGGQWPGKASFGNVMALLYIITILALASALFLISATMNTLIAEQADEIAILKTLGGRRRQIAGITARSAALLGLGGGAAGTTAGVVLAWLLTRYFALKLIDISYGFSVSVPVLAASLLAGPALAIAASWPGLRRALRQPIAGTLAGATASGFGTGWLDRAAARSRLLAGNRLPGSLRMGLRNTLRQRRRSLAAIAQVAMAAGLAISLLALGQSITALISQTIGTLHFSITAGMAPGHGARRFGRQAMAIAAATPGITGAEPVETSSVQYHGQTYPAWGLTARPLYAYRLSAGHWFTTAETAPSTRTAIPPVVLGPAVARTTSARIGHLLTLDLAQGPVRVRVTGIDTIPTNGGDTIYFPLPVLERLDGAPGTADSVWASTASSSHAAIDKAASALGTRLTTAGYPATTSKIYIGEAQLTAADRSILAIVEILGLLVVAIMLIGLASALSMSVFERTREIGILRSLGARARHIRRAFSTEVLALAVTGWAIGTLLGWLLYEGLITLIRHYLALSLPQQFLPAIPFITLAGLLILALLVIRLPLRRATRIQPGTALHYQ